MSFANRVSQVLHDEHGATVALIERLEQLIARHRAGMPDARDHGVARLLEDLVVALENDLERHFSFEEDHLFAYLDATGDGKIGTHLTEDHVVMRPLATTLTALARSARAEGFDETRWSEFRRAGQQLCEHLLAHVQKEEAALLPVIEDGMDAETEARLCSEYLEQM